MTSASTDADEARRRRMMEAYTRRQRERARELKSDDRDTEQSITPAIAQLLRAQGINAESATEKKKEDASASTSSDTETENRRKRKHARLEDESKGSGDTSEENLEGREWDYPDKDDKGEEGGDDGKDTRQTEYEKPGERSRPPRKYSDVGKRIDRLLKKQKTSEPKLNPRAVRSKLVDLIIPVKHGEALQDVIDATNRVFELMAEHVKDWTFMPGNAEFCQKAKHFNTSMLCTVIFFLFGKNHKWGVKYANRKQLTKFQRLENVVASLYASVVETKKTNRVSSSSASTSSVTSEDYSTLT